MREREREEKGRKVEGEWRRGGTTLGLSFAIYSVSF